LLSSDGREFSCPSQQPKYDAPAISKTATVVDVCAWAARGVSEGGAGLSDVNVDILRVQEIDGEVLFVLTDADLEKVMALGPRKKLLAAIERILKQPGTGRLAVPPNLLQVQSS
jgi:hypothetical protein